MTKRNNKDISKDKNNNDINTDDELEHPVKIPKTSNDSEAKKTTIKLKVPIPKIILDQKVETLDDLIALGKLYDPSKEYNIKAFELKDRLVEQYKQLNETINHANLSLPQEVVEDILVDAIISASEKKA
jgi:hypothetical protein